MFNLWLWSPVVLVRHPSGWFPLDLILKFVGSYKHWVFSDCWCRWQFGNLDIFDVVIWHDSSPKKGIPGILHRWWKPGVVNHDLFPVLTVRISNPRNGFGFAGMVGRHSFDGCHIWGILFSGRVLVTNNLVGILNILGNHWAAVRPFSIFSNRNRGSIVRSIQFQIGQTTLYNFEILVTLEKLITTAWRIDIRILNIILQNSQGNPGKGCINNFSSIQCTVVTCLGRLPGCTIRCRHRNWFGLRLRIFVIRTGCECQCRKTDRP